MFVNFRYTVTKKTNYLTLNKIMIQLNIYLVKYYRFEMEWVKEFLLFYIQVGGQYK